MYLHTEDPQILVITVMYLVVQVTWCSGFVHPCLKCFLWPSFSGDRSSRRFIQLCNIVNATNLL